MEQLLDRLQRLPVEGGDDPAGVMAEASGAAADLLDLLDLELTILDAVILFIRIETQRMRRQVEAHTHGIGGDHDVRLAFAKAARLLAADFRRQRTVDHRDAFAGHLQHRLEFQYRPAAEGDQHRAGVQLLEVGRAAGHIDRRQAFGALDYQLVFAQVAQGLQRRLDQLWAGHDQVLGVGTDQRIDPGPAALRVGHHLYFVDHHHVP